MSELTTEQVNELRRLVRQLRHPTPWAASIEWFPDRGLPERLQTELVRVHTHQAGNDLVLDSDNGNVADVVAKEDAVAIAAVMTFAPALLDEIERLRIELAHRGER